MNLPFIYDRYVTNRDFIGRKNERFALDNLLDAHENVVIYEPPKCGKRSLVQEVLFSRRLNGKQFVVSGLDMFNIRNTETLLVKFGNAVIRSVASSPQEYIDIIKRHLAKTHFVFDRARFANYDEVVSLNWSADANDMCAMFSLPVKISEERGEDMVVLLEEFQSILLYDDYDTPLKALETMFLETKDLIYNKCSFIITGSKVNAMKYIFEEKKYFYRLVERIALSPLDEKELVEHLRKGFLKIGKEIERDLALGACHLLKCNIWYLNHLFSICNSLSIGYINEANMLDSLNTLISIHEPRLLSIVSSLTENQINFLKAVLDGVRKFNSTDVIEKYELHSSANVKRVKDALLKKEVITFTDNNSPVFIDPLFEYWIKTKYFEIS